MSISTRRSIALTLVAGCVVAISACSGGGGSTEGEPRASTGGGSEHSLIVDRTEDYESTEELVDDSALVVRGHVAEGEISYVPGFEDALIPMASVDFVVDEGYMGKFTAGDTIPLAAEGYVDENGVLQTDKVVVGQDYLVYLAPLGDVAPGVFAITGYLSGLYEETSPGEFEQLDPESPDLPEELSEGDVVEQVESP